ncbi:AMP-binding protein [Sphingomonas oligophenolica]|uniref:AMP-binding protein n=1 Tax=Sphingomonas oligophenolica TaxID=301154 RepID=A0ABU9Y9G5_9SPHN
MTTPDTIAAILRDRARSDADSVAYTYLPFGTGRDTSLTYAELDRKAREVAVRLIEAVGQDGAMPADTPVLLVYPAGLDFLVGFFGCLYAGAIAVPVRYPNPRRPLTHLKSVAADSGAPVVLTTAEMRPTLAEQLGQTMILTPENLAAADPGAWHDPGITPDHIAHLQYTSGSTAAPKGVAIRHRHIMANSRDLAALWQVGPDSRALSWLPHYHDLGLIFGCLQPAFAGCPGFLMNPATFSQRPLTWLEAITSHRITHTAAPNFAYQSCAAIAEEQRQGLDLSSLCVVANGAEPVRADTIEAFATAYAAYGFRAEAMCPAYGMAESTLVATTSGPDRVPTTVTVTHDGLIDGRLIPVGRDDPGRALVSSSGAETPTRVLVVDPETGEQLAPGRIGEIWLSGPSIAAGYWRRPEATREKFNARLAGGDGEDFLRTGDLGGVLDESLFVLGRIDDLIIVRGVNHGAEDIELAVESCDPALEPGGGAAFTVEVQGEPRLIVAHEVRRSALRTLDGDSEGGTGDRILRAIRRAVSEQHDLEVSAVVLLGPRGLPKTHSGKKQRHGCRRDFLAGTLPSVLTWIAPRLRDAAGPEAEFLKLTAVKGVGRAAEPLHHSAPQATQNPIGESAAVDDLLDWLRSYAGERLNSRLMDERRSIPPYVVLDLGNHGVLGLQAPRAYGGLGLSNSALGAIVQQIAAIDTTLASFVLVNNGLGIRPILRFATEEKRDQLLPILAPGRELASFAMTEANAGSNIRNLASIGRPDGAGGWSLWGTKLWSGSASWAGVINTFVKLEDDGPGAPRGVSGFVLRQGSPGLRSGPEALTMGMRAMVQSEVMLEGVRVTAADRLGDLGDGMAAAMDTMEFGRFTIGTLSVGIIKRCLQLMVRHGTRRSIATGRLIDNPASLMRMSDLSAAATAIGALTESVGAWLDRGIDIPPELFCVCKTAGPEFAWRAADGLMQQLAGRGFVETNIVPQILRDTRVLRIFEGPTEPMNMHVGSRLIHLPEQLGRFMAEELGEPVLAEELRGAGQSIWAHCLDSGLGLGGPNAAKQWAYLQIGEVANYALLLACVRHRHRAGPTPLLARAAIWCRLRFERRLAKALAATPAAATLLDAGQIEELVAGYAGAIGDIEQTLAGEDNRLDALLARSTAAAAAPAVAPAETPAVRLEPAPSGPMGAILDWLKDWLAAEYGQSRATIAPGDRFSDFGMDSVTATMLGGALEQHLGVALSPTLVWEYPTLGAMAAHLAAIGPAITGGSPSGSAPSHRNEDLSVLARLDQLSEAELEALLESYAPAQPSGME